MHVRAEVEGRRWNMHAGGGGTCMRAEVEHACRGGGRNACGRIMHALPMCDLRFDLRFHQMFDLRFDLSDLINLIFLRRLRPREPVPAPLDGQGPLPVGISYVGYGWGPYA